MEVPKPATAKARWYMEVAGPPGTDYLVAMVSDAPRRFEGAGLVAGEVFAEFPIARVAQLQRAHTGKAPLLAGVTGCAAPPCPQAYGAAAFTVEEVEQ